MTALVMKGDRERCMEAGMDGYLSKPIRPQELDQVLDGYIARGDEALAAPTPQQPSESAVAVTELLDRVGGDQGLLAELLDLFRGDYPAQIRALKEAAKTGDSATLQRIGHALKGALSNLSATTACQLASELEILGKADAPAAAADKINRLEQEIHRAIQALETLCMEPVK
jgi:HPt (histidine-containing phosphotransfer) domain-containing protein